MNYDTITTADGKYAVINHNHDTSYYLKSEVNSLLDDHTGNNTRHIDNAITNP